MGIQQCFHDWAMFGFYYTALNPSRLKSEDSLKILHHLPLFKQKCHVKF